MFSLDCHVFGPYKTCVYVLTSIEENISVIIDAAPGSFEGLKDQVAKRDIHLFLTHGHWDHISDAAKFQHELNAHIYAHPSDAMWWSNQVSLFPLVETFTPDTYVKDFVDCGSLHIQTLHTPGHTAGQIALYIESMQCVFVGDSLFYKTIGRTDLPGANINQLKDSIQHTLYKLPDHTRVYPGHGLPTRIGVEKANNLMVRTDSSSI